MVIMVTITKYSYHGYYMVTMFTITKYSYYMVTIWLLYNGYYNLTYSYHGYFTMVTIT